MTIGKIRRVTTTSGLVKTSVQFAAEQLEEIDRLATHKRLSRPAMVRLLVDVGLQQMRKLDRLAEVVG